MPHGLHKLLTIKYKSLQISINVLTGSSDRPIFTLHSVKGPATWLKCAAGLYQQENNMIVFEHNTIGITEDGFIKTFDDGAETGTPQVICTDYITNAELCELEEAITIIKDFRKNLNKGEK